MLVGSSSFNGGGSITSSITHHQQLPSSFSSIANNNISGISGQHQQEHISSNNGSAIDTMNADTNSSATAAIAMPDPETDADPETGAVTKPRDSDVMCGRGGAAHRHPGNQTYRRLVTLNKGLYTTCLKTEKLKISKSIVAAIREQHGRFLEKLEKLATNTTDADVWYDMGDKKAVEKTSQALREGQPKLRQQMASNNLLQQKMLH